MRIEPGEIESQMLGHAKIKSVVVAVKEDGERKMLCAYYEVTEDISVQEIRSYLRSKLPLHMVPSYYLKMDKLPLSAGGKVNRAALPGVNNMIFNEGSEYVKPGDETEEKLAVIVQNLLNRKRISMKDNFFDLGGDSLSLTTLVFDIIDNFGIDIPLEYFFRANDIKEIADLIKESSDSHGDKKDARDLILIHKGILGAKDIFLIHDGIGGIGAYFDLAEYLDEYNVWGIRAESEFGIWPQNLDIEALAESYAGRIIEKSSPPYNIGGWCIGGTIAFETARQLEKMDCKVETLLILDTIPPMRWKGAQRFSVEGEKKFISENIGHGGLTKYIKDAGQIQELWQKTVESIDSSIYREDIINNFISRIPEDIKLYLEEYHTYTAGEIFLFINRLRTFHISRALYFPKGKVGADVLCFQAADNSVAEDSTIWDGYSSGRIEHIMISGDHNTMLKSNGAKSIAKVIKDRVK